MATALNTNGVELTIPTPLNPDFKFAIITAEWNDGITHALRDAAEKTLLQAGVKKENINLWSVPGTVELVNIAATLVDKGDLAGVITIGCVIRGDTPHFDYVCMQAAQGVAALNTKGKTPVTFGVITTENLQQALDRAGGRLGNKGAEAACAALEMANVKYRIFES